MTELIKIHADYFKGAEVNAVNARELHETLEVKKAFTTWIDTSLDNAGAIVDEDYIKLKTSLEGSGYRIDYMVTADLAKHIAMMSKVPKAKEVRDYFIEAEKQVLSISNELQAIQKMLDVSINHESRLDKIENNSRLTTQQEFALMQAKNEKVYQLIDAHQLIPATVHRKVWQLFKKKFSLPRYNELSNGQFNDGLDYIRSLSLADLV